MQSIRLVLIHTLISVIVCSSMLALGWWWFSVSYLPSVSEADGDTESATSTSALAATVPSTTIPAVVADTLPAVVSIVVTAEVPLYERYLEQYSPFGGWWGGFAVPRQRQIGTEEREIGGGTGFFVTADGFLVTNRHVVEQTGVSYTVVTNDGNTYPVSVVARDPMLDVAILKVDAPEQTFPHLEFAAADSVQLGQPAIAIGNALAEFPNSVSVGVISGLSRSIVAQSRYSQEMLEGLIQTDAAINQGNSGGPLLNTDGEVVGVNVAMAGNSENIGFALPGAMVAQVLEGVLETGEIVRPFLGIRYMQIDDRLAERNTLPVDYGVLVVRGETPSDLAVMPDSPADRAGIVENDIILALDGTRLDGDQSLASLLRNYAPGDTVTLTLWRDGAETTVSLTLASLPE